MTTAFIIFGTATQGVSQWLSAHIRIDVNGTDTDVRQSHVNSVAFKVYEDGTRIDSTGTEISDSTPGEALVVANVVFDTLQNNDRWKHADHFGYNLSFLLDEGYLPEAHRIYRIRTDVQLASGGAMPVAFEINTSAVFETSPGVCSTPTSTTESYASGNDCLTFFDARVIGDLLNDMGVRVEPADIPSNPTLNSLLLTASGRVEASAIKGHRYEVCDLQSLTGASQRYLKQIVCLLAIGQAGITRRSLAGIAAEPLSWAEARLKELANGEEIFGLVETQDAGVEELVIRQPGSSAVPRVVDEAGRYFGRWSRGTGRGGW